MGFFSSLFGGKQDDGMGHFLTEKAYAQNRTRQLAMTPQTMAQLKKHGITNESQMKLEYFFYTNTEEKAAALNRKLAELDYTGNYELSAANKKQFLVNGWTTRMKMDVQTVLEWTAKMCDVGFEFDCDFDGWGTSTSQS